MPHINSFDGIIMYAYIAVGGNMFKIEKDFNGQPGWSVLDKSNNVIGVYNDKAHADMEVRKQIKIILNRG